MPFSLRASVALGAWLVLLCTGGASGADLLDSQTIRHHEITLSRTMDGSAVTLTGVLTLPAGSGPYPAVYLIPGAGAVDRDGTIFGYKPLLQVSEHLARAGYAVLRIDDRGTGGSSGSKMESTLRDLTDDLRTAIGYLRHHDSIDRERIVALGHSLGGLLSIRAAAGSPDLAGVILVACPMTSGATALARMQVQAGLGNKTLNDRIANALTAILNDPRAGQSPEKILERWRQRCMMFDGWPAAEIESVVDSLQGLYLEFVSVPLLKSTLAYDPAADLERLRCPVLALTGQEDPMLPHLDTMREILLRSGNPDFEIVPLADVNHFLTEGRVADPESLGERGATVASDLLEKLVVWLDVRFKGCSAPPKAKGR